MTYTLDELKYRLTAAAKTRGRKELSCGTEVVAALRDAIPPAEPVPPGQPSPALLMGVDIIDDPAMEPRQFRLVRHSDCSVDTVRLTVSHGWCPVTAGGILDAVIAS
jgi:hypothetical protein